MKKDVTSLALGSKVRALRQRLKHTLDETARGAGISKGFLSQVERGRATPSLSSLTGIANSLGVTVQYFFNTPSEERSVIRGNRMTVFNLVDSANTFAYLTSTSSGRQLAAILVRMPPGYGRPEIIAHSGEEFLYVLEGEIALTRGGETLVLQAGDSAHYDSSVAHSWANTACKESTIVCVVMSPHSCGPFHTTV